MKRIALLNQSEDHGSPNKLGLETDDVVPNLERKMNS
jgi:hypothetical protein